MAPEPTGSDEIRRFEAQYRRNPDGLVFARLADAHRKNGDPERAMSILRDGIGRHPDYPSAHIVRARCLVDLDRPVEAEESLRRVLELDARNLVAMRGLASLAERRDDALEAAGWFEQIATLDPMNVEAEAALERLRPELPHPPAGMEPLPAPREEWWSSPAPETTGGEGGETSDAVERDPQADSGPHAGERDEPEETDALEGPDASVGPDALEASLEPEAGTAEELLREESVDRELPADSESGQAWWFEDPGEEEAGDDGDLLTRTMADLYLKQGLLNEAAAIYRELLADRPDDEDLRRALAEVKRRLEPAGEAEPPEADGAASAGGTATKRAQASTDEQPVAPPTRLPEDERPRQDGGDRASGSHAYSSHPVPEQAGVSDVFRDWVRRLTG